MVNFIGRDASVPLIDTFCPTAKSDAPPSTSNLLSISDPYQYGIRCGTKNAPTSAGEASINCSN